jgi:hypothetical protein
VSSLAVKLKSLQAEKDAMKVKARCNCGGWIVGPSSAAGKRVKCPSCGTIVVFSSASAEPAITTPSPRPGPSVVRGNPNEAGPGSGAQVRGAPPVRRHVYVAILGVLCLLGLGTGAYFLICKPRHADNAVVIHVPPVAPELQENEPAVDPAPLPANGDANGAKTVDEVPDKPKPRQSASERDNPAPPSPTPERRASAAASGATKVEQDGQGAQRSAGTPASPRLIVTFEPEASSVAKLESASFALDQSFYKVRRLKLDLQPRALRLAVTPPKWDDLGQLLRQLGPGFGFTPVTLQYLQKLENCQKFDVIFLTCDVVGPEDIRAAPAIRKFVEQGGTLYASDQKYFFVKGSFPEFGAANEPVSGSVQTVKATSVDAGLREYLGTGEVPLKFDLRTWIPAEFDRTKTTTILAGSYRTSAGKIADSPLLVKFHPKAGTVIFTSFHNERQVSQLERKLLEYLVFSTVNAKAESQIMAVLKENGFDAVKTKFTHLESAKSVLSETIAHGGGRLQIGIGFEHLGGRLTVKVVSPKGDEIRHAENGTFMIEVSDAVQGQWRYSIEATQIPFPNFPVILAYASTKSK